MRNNLWKFIALGSLALLIIMTYLNFSVKPEDIPNFTPKATESAAYEEKPTAVQVERVDEVEKRKEFLRESWEKLVRVDLVGYKPHDFGGMSDVYIQVRNHMEFDAELIQVQVQYVLANGKVYQTIEVPVANIPANGISRKVKIEDSKRGKTLRMEPIRLVCKAIESEP